jgi:D-lactate dehydrogenase
LEDSAVPVDSLAHTGLRLKELFKQFDYHDAVIFGHAKDGNIHFLINEDFSDAQKVLRYKAFTEEIVELVLSQKGSLKAEHGTGRMMAPFVQRQFGVELYDIMIAIKNAFDPEKILNPGVLISADEQAHIRDIKMNPTITPIADKCVECGYCEPICPSKNLTATPRQRIVIQRAIEVANQAGNFSLAKELTRESDYTVVDTCAADSLCSISCPLGIDTGEMVKNLRSQRIQPRANRLWERFASDWAQPLKAIRLALNTAALFPAPITHAANGVLRNLLGKENVPLWNQSLPRGGKSRERFLPSEKIDTQKIDPSSPDFVFFVSCLDEMFQSETAQAMVSLSKKAGFTFSIPSGIHSLCCGTPWKSKGHEAGYQEMAKKSYQALLEASNNGAIPIITENSSCSEGLMEIIKLTPNSPLRIIDAIDYVASEIISRLSINSKLNKVVLHPTCSSSRLNSIDSLQVIAQAISHDVNTPIDWSCCGFAGDRGMLHPELTASATHAESKEVTAIEYDAYLSTNRSCEIGMKTATGKNYEHALCVLDRLSK